jgi:hypothetical protein
LRQGSSKTAKSGGGNENVTHLGGECKLKR